MFINDGFKLLKMVFDCRIIEAFGAFGIKSGGSAVLYSIPVTSQESSEPVLSGHGAAYILDKGRDRPMIKRLRHHP